MRDKSISYSLISILFWLISLMLVIIAILLGFGKIDVGAMQKAPFESPIESSAENSRYVETYKESDGVLAPPETTSVLSIERAINVNTIIPERPRVRALEYLVVAGDSVFGIAETFDLKPETILWSNYSTLHDNPHELSIAMTLEIPPIDGVYYEWEAEDTLESVADRFEVEKTVITSYVGNQFDLVSPVFYDGMMVMIPGGQREFQQWIIPTIPRGAAGVSAGIYGGGACAGGYSGGAYGSGAFIWPTSNHFISGNDYWSGHLAIDIGLVVGDPIFAADSGVIVFAGWASGGYGNVVAIDHGNGYQTLYAHLNAVNVGCGQSVGRGQIIASGGSTGNSTGPHLHFEVRYQGGFVNPWYVLPSQ